MMSLVQLTGLSLAAISFWFFAAVAVLTGLMTCALFYHWVRYNPGIVSTLIVMAVYLIGTLMLLLSIFGVIAQL
jgi:hypothetical protein